jgi:hypothetical protein
MTFDVPSNLDMRFFVGGGGVMYIGDEGVRLVGTSATTSSANVNRGSDGVLRSPTSDSRIKTNILDIEAGLDVVKGLKPVVFTSLVDDAKKTTSGYLAQDVRSLFPGNYTVVAENPDIVPDIPNIDKEDFVANPLLSLNHIELLPYLTKAIQELSEKNDALEARLEALEGN